MSDETAKELERAGQVSDDEARQILSRFNSSHWKNPTERARYSIPADPRRDDDIRLDAYIAQTRALRAERDRLAEALEEEQRTSATWETILTGEREHRGRLLDALDAASKGLAEIGVEWRTSTGKCKWCGGWDMDATTKAGTHHGNCPTIIARDTIAAITKATSP